MQEHFVVKDLIIAMIQEQLKFKNILDTFLKKLAIRLRGINKLNSHKKL
jgi:hypothetical protein